MAHVWPYMFLFVFGPFSIPCCVLYVFRYLFAYVSIDVSSCCIFGVPLYDTTPCVLYLVEQLIKNGFDVKYTHPNLLYISWLNRKNKQTNNNLTNNSKNNSTNNSNLLAYDKRQIRNNIKASQGYKLVDNYNPSTKLINTSSGYNRRLQDFENKSDNLFSL